MRHPTLSRFAIAAITTLCLATAGPSIAQPDGPVEATLHQDDTPRHKFNVNTQSMRGLTFLCGDLELRVTRGFLTETTDADLRDGVTRISISRIAHGLRLRGSDGRTYRASGVTAAWFVLRKPDNQTPVHGLEVTQVMFRGGPDKSPGWLREQIKWVDKHETESMHGPCTFAD